MIIEHTLVSFVILEVLIIICILHLKLAAVSFICTSPVTIWLNMRSKNELQTYFTVGGPFDCLKHV